MARWLAWPVLLAGVVCALDTVYSPFPSPHNSTGYPQTLLQYGQMRSASTHQTQILLIMACLRHEIRSVRKTHDKPKPVDLRGAWLFASSAPETAHLGRHVKVSHSRGEMRKQGFAYIENAIRAEYAPLFHLNETEVKDAVDYMRIWDSLRQCCGLGISRQFAAELRGEHPKRKHACWKVNAGRAERRLMRTKIYNQCPLLGLQSTAIYDQQVAGRMDGHWCARTAALWRSGMVTNAYNLRNMSTLTVPFEKFTAKDCCCPGTHCPGRPAAPF